MGAVDPGDRRSYLTGRREGSSADRCLWAARAARASRRGISHAASALTRGARFVNLECCMRSARMGMVDADIALPASCSSPADDLWRGDTRLIATSGVASLPPSLPAATEARRPPIYGALRGMRRNRSRRSSSSWPATPAHKRSSCPVSSRRS
jgi:hypothetical protein